MVDSTSSGYWRGALPVPATTSLYQTSARRAFDQCNENDYIRAPSAPTWFWGCDAYTTERWARSRGLDRVQKQLWVKRQMNIQRTTTVEIRRTSVTLCPKYTPRWVPVFCLNFRGFFTNYKYLWIGWLVVQFLNFWMEVLTSVFFKRNALRAQRGRTHLVTATLCESLMCAIFVTSTQ